MDFAVDWVVLAPLGIYALTVPLPGPSFVLISQTSIREGGRHGFFAGLGTSAGVAVYALAAVCGLTVLLDRMPGLTLAIQILGGVYLLYLGLSALWQARKLGTKGAVTGTLENGTGETALVSFRKGLFISLGNPKIAAFFGGLFAPALSVNTSTASSLVLFIGVVLIDLFYHQFLAWSFTAGRHSLKRLGRAFDMAVAGCLSVFGLGLIVHAVRNH